MQCPARCGAEPESDEDAKQQHEQAQEAPGGDRAEDPDRPHVKRRGARAGVHVGAVLAGRDRPTGRNRANAQGLLVLLRPDHQRDARRLGGSSRGLGARPLIEATLERPVSDDDRVALRADLLQSGERRVKLDAQAMARRGGRVALGLHTGAGAHRGLAGTHGLVVLCGEQLALARRSSARTLELFREFANFPPELDIRR